MKKIKYFIIGLVAISIFAGDISVSARRRYRKKRTYRKRRRVSIFGPNIMEKAKGGYKKIDKFYRGIYLHCYTGRSMKRMKRFVREAKKVGVNAFVIDVQPYKSLRPVINPKVIKYLIKNNIYPIARIVAFQYGLKKYPVAKSHMRKVMRLVDLSVKAGFKEVQFDYIRFADKRLPYSIKQRYAFIEAILKEVKNKLKPHGVLLATDVFGRVVYNRNDRIGQQLESMSKYADVICPMVYPSHYVPDRYKLSHPHFTVKHSTIKGLNRVGSHTFIMPYIQAFKYNVGWARMSLKKYIIEQIRAVEETAARGWILWNARNRYTLSFRAIKEFNRKYAHLKKKQDKRGS